MNDMNCSQLQTVNFKRRCSLRYKAEDFNAVIYHRALVWIVVRSHNNASGNSLFQQKQNDHLLALGTSQASFNKQMNRNVCHHCIHQSNNPFAESHAIKALRYL